MIQIKRGSTKSWRGTKVKLAAGQPGYDKEKHKIKIGDGKSEWAELPYASGLSAKEVLDSESAAKIRNSQDSEDKTIITYGTEVPNKDTVGQVYLQYYNTAPETDYVVSSGINGSWSYQKWNSGIAKCWGTFELETLIQLAIGNDLLYQSNNELKQIDYPFAFKEKPSESATVQSAGSLVWLASAKNLNTTKKSASYSLISPDKVINTATYTVTVKVEGLWK